LQLFLTFLEDFLQAQDLTLHPLPSPILRFSSEFLKVDSCQNELIWNEKLTSDLGWFSLKSLAWRLWSWISFNLWVDCFKKNVFRISSPDLSSPTKIVDLDCNKCKNDFQVGNYL
jgi:hypothetical protein